MGRTDTIIDDFSVGEVSPLTEAKISSTEFKDGLREATNVVPDTHGPVIGRPGFKQVTSLLGIDPNDNVTTFTIQYSPTEYWIVVLYHQEIEVWTPDGVMLGTHHTLMTEEDLHGPNGDEHLAFAFVSPSGKILNILTGTRHPYEVVMSYDDQTSLWSVDFHDTPFTGTVDPWSSGKFPTCGDYFQGRIWYGGCEDQPDTFWGSKALDYYDLDFSKPPKDDEGIEFQISKHGRIRWIKGGKNLLIGTEIGEVLVESEAGFITGIDIGVVLQSTFGSSRIDAKLVGNEVIYVTSDRLKLRSMWWKWVESGWSSIDATFTAEHITRAQISDIDYARNPHSNVWLQLRDGSLVSCSYRRTKSEDSVVGWYRISSDHLVIKAITVAENLGTSELWAVVRSRDGANRTAHLVVYTPPDYHDDSRVFLDDYVTVVNDPPANTVDVAGKTLSPVVSVVADGFHLPDMHLESNGIINLPFAASVVSVGHPYVQRMVTMPFLSKSAKGVGAGHHMKRWNKVFVRLLRSYMPKINGRRPPERHAVTHDDVAEPLLNTFVQLTPEMGWDRDGILTIEQDLPFRMVVTGIYGEVGLESI